MPPKSARKGREEIKMLRRKGYAALAGAIGLLAGGLTLDALEFCARLAAPDGEGTALYLLGGLVEINDRIPYAAAGPYLAGLCTAAVLLAAAAVGLAGRAAKSPQNQE